MANPQTTNGFTRISNELFDALCKIRISGEARQMLDVIIRKTYGFGKKEDRIATSQFMQLTGMPCFAIHKARKKLVQMNLITVTKKGNSTITQKGNSQILTYSFQKNYDKWLPLPKKVLLPKKVTNCNQKRSPTVTKKVIHNRKTKDNTIESNVHLSDMDFLKSLKDNVAYGGIDIKIELGKMDAWLSTRPGRKKTRRFIVNWLNKVDKPIEGNNGKRSRTDV